MSKGPHDPDRSTLATRAALAALRLGALKRGKGRGGGWVFVRRGRVRQFSPCTILLLQRRGLCLVAGDSAVLATGATP